MPSKRNRATDSLAQAISVSRNVGNLKGYLSMHAYLKLWQKSGSRHLSRLRSLFKWSLCPNYSVYTCAVRADLLVSHKRVSAELHWNRLCLYWGYKRFSMMHAMKCYYGIRELNTFMNFCGFSCWLCFKVHEKRIDLLSLIRNQSTTV